MRLRYKQWAVDYLSQHPEVIIDKVDFTDAFFKNTISLEIGSGKGEFITSYAAMHQDENYLAIERVPTIAGILTKKVVESELHNVRIFPHDGEALFNDIPDGSVDKIFLNFVDPWPKKKHAKRRLTYHKFLEEYYRILKPNGLVIFKSDNDSLYESSQEEIALTKFVVLTNEEDYKFDQANDALTGYEEKFRGLGHHIHRLILKKE